MAAFFMVLNTIMNIFEQAIEFVEWDNRKDRKVNQITAESLFNRLTVQFPEWLVKDETVLDLGSCLGAAGHMALTRGASHYTGVEIQEKYVNDSRAIFEKYWSPEQYSISKENLETFLDDAISKNIQYDHVIASGVLYAFVNIISILEKISKVSRKTLLIDTMFIANNPEKGIILLRPDMPMNYSEGPKTFSGIGSTCNLKALDIIMNLNYFARQEDKIFPPVTKNSHDGYTDIVEHPEERKGPVRFMARYHRKKDKADSLLDKIIKRDRDSITDFYDVPPMIKTGAEIEWKFDENVAKRFPKEAEQHIPDYYEVIDMCLTIAKKNLESKDKIIDIGSALGFTVNKFIQEGFINTYGVDNSEKMIAASQHKEKIFLSDTLPSGLYKMILMNWTLHFVLDKEKYLTDIYNNLAQAGYFILTDKTFQSLSTKEMYYKFKEDNGVSLEYIKKKENKLKGVMHSMSAQWYFTMLDKVGFKNIEVINAKYGFITFVCRK